MHWFHLVSSCCHFGCSGSKHVRSRVGIVEAAKTRPLHGPTIWPKTPKSSCSHSILRAGFTGHPHVPS
eukprot:s2076_g7.t1